jgi:DNA-binding NtrC family response regulator
MHLEATNQPKSLARLAREDEVLAGRSAARLLITAAAPEHVEVLARRIHGAGSRSGSPFVRRRGRELPVGQHQLRDACSALLDAAAGGSLLIADVEEMPSAAQEQWIDLLVELESMRAPSTTVRLICGTTVSLLDRVAAGTFSGQLFYRINVIHLVAAASLRKSGVVWPAAALPRRATRRGDA